MFHQVIVDPRDCDVLRFLWWPDGDLTKQLVEYRMTKHVFEAKYSPSIADFCLKKTADLEKDGIEPEAVETVKKNIYIDNLMKSTSTTQKAVNLVDQLRELLARGGFRLTKWCSNDQEVLAAIPESERAKSVANLDIEHLPTESTLGVKWNVEEDKFVWEISQERFTVVSNKPNSQGILSVIYSMFDPLGFITPFTMKAKLLLQILSRMKIGWDDQIGETERTQWIRWLEYLPKLTELQVDRCFKPETLGDIKSVELHLFSDASRVGYSAVAYLRLVDVNGCIHCAFVMGKAQLAPIREISIPRLELNAAVVLVKLRVLECMRRNVRPGEQFMGNLPWDRISPNKPPFTNVGIDYFGPFEVKQGCSRVKRYGCVFTCLAVHAIHMEITHSLDTDSMINALRRFICIRGCPERI
jgi:hypothetical protein